MSCDCLTAEELHQEIRDAILSFLRSDEGREMIREIAREGAGDD